jgi:hypothetical protein
VGIAVTGYFITVIVYLTFHGGRDAPPWCKAATEAIVVGLEKHGLEPIDALGDMVGKSARSCKLSP